MRTKLSPLAAVLIFAFCADAGAASVKSPVAPLADRIPADALVYLGWAGTDHLPGYDASHLKAVVDASELSRLVEQVVPSVTAKLGENDPQAGKMAGQITDMMRPMWHHPTALYFGGIELNGPAVPKLAVLCDAGRDAPAVVDQITAVVDQARRQVPPGLPAITVKQYGSLVVAAFGGESDVDDRFEKPPADPLDKSPEFLAAIKQVDTHPVLIGYVDARALVSAVDDSIGKMADEKTVDRWNTAKAALGLGQVKWILVAGGFDGADWVDEQWVATTGTDGLAGLFAVKPLDPDLLAVVPKTADRMGLFQFDPGASADGLRKAIAAIDPQSARKVDGFLANLNKQVGLDVQKDLLDHLGPQWVHYSDRTISGTGPAGTVLINRLKDPEAFDAGINELAGRANKIIADRMNDPNLHVEFRSETVDGVTLHYFAAPLVTPCWAVKDGYLFMGLYPQTVSAAVAQVTEKAPSILQRPEYVALMKRLGNKPAATVEFVDLPATAGESYGDLLAWSRDLLGTSDLVGITTPAMTIPPLRKILPQLAPGGGVTWTDAAGWHRKAISPFPGAMLLAGV